MFLESEEKVTEYLQFWKSSISDIIQYKTTDKSIHDYPDIIEAFNAVEETWKEAFKSEDKTADIYMQKALKRDEAIKKLTDVIKKTFS